jgi:hypothetical protein
MTGADNRAYLIEVPAEAQMDTALNPLQTAYCAAHRAARS